EITLGVPSISAPRRERSGECGGMGYVSLLASKGQSLVAVAGSRGHGVAGLLAQRGHVSALFQSSGRFRQILPSHARTLAGVRGDHAVGNGRSWSLSVAYAHQLVRRAGAPER